MANPHTELTMHTETRSWAADVAAGFVPANCDMRAFVFARMTRRASADVASGGPNLMMAARVSSNPVMQLQAKQQVHE